MTRIRLAAAAALLALAAATPAQAQLSVAGGPTFALGSLGDATEMGYHAQGSFGLSLPLFPISLRIDGAWNQFPESDTEGDFRVISGTANAMFSIPSIAITPYVIGGLGAYNARWSDDSTVGSLGEDESSTEIGANVGVGIRFGLPGLSAFAEARLHNLFNDGDAIRFVPVSVGLRF
jgi:hypothetical protein